MAWFHLAEIFRKGKFIELKSRYLVGGINGHQGSYQSDENVLKVDMVMTKPLSKFTKKSLNCAFKLGNFMISKIYPNKAVKIRQRFFSIYK